jgi:hypothetical protein
MKTIGQQKLTAKQMALVDHLVATGEPLARAAEAAGYAADRDTRTQRYGSCSEGIALGFGC